MLVWPARPYEHTKRCSEHEDYHAQCALLFSFLGTNDILHRLWLSVAFSGVFINVSNPVILVKLIVLTLINFDSSADVEYI